MGNTVSRRFVFVKMKRKRPPSKPRPPIRDDDEFIGEAARPMRPFVPPSLVSIQRKSPWPLIAAGIGGVVAVAGLIALLASLGGRPMVADDTPVKNTRNYGSMPTNPAYSRASSSAGYPGSGAGAPSQSAATAQGFLASPFPKRKPTSCAVQIDGSKESLRDFNKCLEDANDPGATLAKK